MGRLATIFSHAGFLELEQHNKQVTVIPHQVPTQSHAKAANASVINSDTSLGLDTIAQ